MANSETGIIYMAATPIGNPGDATSRLREVLASADLVAAEDTRRLRGLCARLGVEISGSVLAFHDHVEGERAAELVDAALAGKTVLVVSDAGTPTVSDPGYELGALAGRAGVRVSPLPGPSAALAALSVAGLPTDRFTFEGFLPRKGSGRATRISELAREPRTMVIFESPRRAAKTLADLCDAFGRGRPAALCRELTKTHEEVLRATLGELADHAADTEILGEVTLVVGGCVPEEADVEALAQEALRICREDGIRLKTAAQSVARRAGARPNVVFRAALETSQAE